MAEAMRADGESVDDGVSTRHMHIRDAPTRGESSDAWTLETDEVMAQQEAPLRTLPASLRYRRRA